MIELQAGTRIKHYVLQERLGRGAAGDVWRASDSSQEVAIKFMNLGMPSPPGLLSPEERGEKPEPEPAKLLDEREKYRKSLEAEVKALRKLQHPNIPALYDYDLSGERPYLVMQHVGGLTYDRLIPNGDLLRIPVEKRLDALYAIATAVVAAHEQGIIHRDIKPGNVSGIETPYLLDFGIALDSGRSRQAQPDIGTGIYMPPDGPADVLSDNYSFAVLAYEVLFGRHPIFTRETIGKTVLETRRIAGERLRLGDWRWPSLVPLPELPGDVYGANFERLDAIYAQAFGARESRYTDVLRLVADLREAIVTPENQPYLNSPAPPILSAPPIPTEEAYTANEVAIDRQPTDYGLHDAVQKPSRNWLLFASTVALVIWFMLIGLLVVLYRG
jgi:serine/threonine protein kinase